MFNLKFRKLKAVDKNVKELKENTTEMPRQVPQVS